MGCQYIDFDESKKKEIYDLLCLSFANALLHEKIKFHRTKLKPLIRHRTLVKSTGIHIELEALHKSLEIRKFIQNARKKRKKECNKSNIIAAHFFVELQKFTKKQYVNQKRKVYQLLDLQFNDQIISNDVIFGDDIQSDIDDDDHSNHDDDDKFNHNSSDSPSSDSFLSDNIHYNKRCKVSKKKKINNKNNGKR